MDSSVQLQQQLADALERSQALESDVQALSDELAQYDRWESAQERRQLAALTTDADTAAQRVHSLTQQLEEDRVPDMETIGRLRGAIVNLETVRKNVEKARTDRDEAMKALLRAEKNVNDSPFAGQTAESARKEAQGTSSDRVPGPIAFRELAIFFCFLRRQAASLPCCTRSCPSFLCPSFSWCPGPFPHWRQPLWQQPAPIFPASTDSTL